MNRSIVAVVTAPFLALGCAGLHIVTPGGHGASSTDRQANNVEDEKRDRAVEARALGLVPDDSVDLARVDAALQAGGAAHLVYAQGDRGYDYAPVEMIDHQRCIDSTRQDASKLGQYRAAVNGFEANGDGIVAPRKSIHLYCAADGSLGPGTPGVIWTILEPGKREDSGAYWTAWKPGRALFVTLDGGRYITPIGNLAVTRPAGAPPTEPLHDALLLPTDVDALVKRGMLAASLADAMKRADTAWAECQDTTWKPFDARWEANKVADLTEQTRTNRRVQIVEEWTKVTQQRCMQHVAAYEQALAAAIEARNAARRAVGDKARALVAAGG